MGMTEEKILKEIVYIRMEGNQARGRPRTK